MSDALAASGRHPRRNVGHQLPTGRGHLAWVPASRTAVLVAVKSRQLSIMPRGALRVHPVAPLVSVTQSSSVRVCRRRNRRGPTRGSGERSRAAKGQLPTHVPARRFTLGPKVLGRLANTLATHFRGEVCCRAFRWGADITDTTQHTYTLTKKVRKGWVGKGGSRVHKGRSVVCYAQNRAEIAAAQRNTRPTHFGPQHVPRMRICAPYTDRAPARRLRWRPASTPPTPSAEPHVPLEHRPQRWGAPRARDHERTTQPEAGEPSAAVWSCECRT